MMLTPTELERLTIFVAAELARKRRRKGLKLNHPEAHAYVIDEIMEGAREGKSVAELVGFGATLLSTDDVMPGVARLMPMVQVEGMFPDGAKLVTVHEPIRPGRESVVDRHENRPGEVIVEPGEIELNEGQRRATLRVINTGDRPVQVGSHMHFFEANRELDFERETAFGMRLDVPAGTSRRFEPGEIKEVVLVEFGGTGELGGFNALTNGSIYSDTVKTQALEVARLRGFKGA